MSPAVAISRTVPFIPNASGVDRAGALDAVSTGPKVSTRDCSKSILRCPHNVRHSNADTMPCLIGSRRQCTLLPCKHFATRSNLQSTLCNGHALYWSFVVACTRVALPHQPMSFRTPLGRVRPSWSGKTSGLQLSSNLQLPVHRQWLAMATCQTTWCGPNITSIRSGRCVSTPGACAGLSTHRTVCRFLSTMRLDCWHPCRATSLTSL